MDPARGGASAASSQFDENARRPQGLARKLTCSDVSIVGIGAIIIIIIQVLLTLTAVDGWERGINESMILAEQANLDKLAQAKAIFVSENFDRVRESALQLQASAEQALMEAPETMAVEAYLTQHPGLTESSIENFDYSVCFVPSLGTEALPEAGTPLEGLLNRSSLMDIAFRGMQRQHDLTYLAAVNDPSPPSGTTSEINFQSYPGRDTSRYLFWGYDNECDERYLGDDYDGLSYEPRCRLWYQDAVANGNTGVIITNPYIDADTSNLVITAAAPVFDPTGTLVLGVVGLDIDAKGIESSIVDLRVIGDEGYAYLLSPGDQGQVALHRDLTGDESSTIFDLEPGVGAEEFQGILDTMNDECAGSATYSNGGETWLLSWRHDTASSFQSSASSSSGVATSCGADDFIVVVTVSEPVVIQASSETKTQIARVVMFATLVTALLVLLIMCVMGCVAQSVAAGIAQPVNRLIDTVRSLNNLDFKRQAVGPEIVNGICSPEVEDLMEAFKFMTTVVKFANIELSKGRIVEALAIYIEALVLFIILKNERGVGIVNNNLGNLRAMQAKELATRAARESDCARSKELAEKAQMCYADASTNYELAIGDGKRRLDEHRQRRGDISAPHQIPSPTIGDGVGETKHEHDVEAPGGHPTAVDMNDDGDMSEAALCRQLADRKYNRALSLAGKGNSALIVGRRPDPKDIDDARTLFKECIQLVSTDDPKDQLRRFGYLLELAALEREQPGRYREAGKALSDAGEVLAPYDRSQPDGRPTAAKLLDTPVMILRQRHLEASGAYWVTAGYPEAAIDDYTEAIIGTGDVMDSSAVRSSLSGLRDLVSEDSHHARYFSTELLRILRLPPRLGDDPGPLTSAIDNALAKVATEEASMREKTTVDLCFVMDCTGSMQSWIDQAITKLMEIIAQAKRVVADIDNVTLRVAFVGYRDIKDKVRYEGPFDFHEEDELPELLVKLTEIEADGGDDIPEDMAGGLHLATGLKWRGDIRLCILIADAPCHGSIYHDETDNYPRGCPKGRDPRELLYTLRHEIGADFYFIRINGFTDKMIRVFRNAMSSMWAQKHSKAAEQLLQAPAEQRPDIVVHDLESDVERFLDVVVESVETSVQQKFLWYTT